MIAIAPEYWSVFTNFSLEKLADTLQYLAAQARLDLLLKVPRTPKKKKDPPQYDPRHPHLNDRNSKLTILGGVSATGDAVFVSIKVFGLSPAIKWSKKVMMAACTNFSSMARFSLGG